MLPVDRWMVERLYGEHRRKRTMPPAAWHGRFTPSPASAEPEVQRPPVMEPPAPNPIEPSLRDVGDEFDALADLSEPITAEMVLDEQPPATVDALHLDMFVAPASAEAPEAPEALSDPSPTPPVVPDEAPEFILPSFESSVAPPPAAPPVTPRPIVSHESLDPEVRALVDELYEQARAEMSGADLSFDEPVAETPVTETSVPEPPVSEPEMRPPTGEPVIDVHLPEPEPAPAPTPEPPVPPAAPSASSTSAVGDVIAPANGASESRGGWVPAFVAEDQQRRITD
jgi:hypothetical protein